MCYTCPYCCLLTYCDQHIYHRIHLIIEKLNLDFLVLPELLKGRIDHILTLLSYSIVQ